MANIKHFYREEKVYEECNDRGIKFHDWINKNVEHYCCSECNTEVDKKSSFCSKCGAKFSGVKESYKNSSCEVCGDKFKQLQHEQEECCSRCRGIIRSKYGVELAKAFYKLGKQQ